MLPWWCRVYGEPNLNLSPSFSSFANMTRHGWGKIPCWKAKGEPAKSASRLLKYLIGLSIAFLELYFSSRAFFQCTPFIPWSVLQGTPRTFPQEISPPPLTESHWLIMGAQWQVRCYWKKLLFCCSERWDQCCPREIIGTFVQNTKLEMPFAMSEALALIYRTGPCFAMRPIR